MRKTQIKNGEIDIVCGTHAIIQSDVEIPDLAFIVCDEQHRFGVAQRNALAEKGAGTDTLVMSATPIPRTLSLIFYGDLDITTIKDKPKERKEDEDKTALMQILMDAVKPTAESLEKTKNGEFEFTFNGRKFKVVLSAPRK